MTSYRQKGRTFASASSMVRDVDETSAKPETDTSAEVVTEPLHQIATISTATPNILLANDGFRSWVNGDLLGAYRAAVDFHIVDAISGAGIQDSGGVGANTCEDILYAQELVKEEGYTPNIVVVSPADALTIQLLQLSSGTTYVFGQVPPTMVVSPAVQDGAGFVADSRALGILFLGPFTLATFEEEAGSTNTSTVRAESTGLYLVQRPGAAATLAEGSSS